jgi:hypothetical protein
VNDEMILTNHLIGVCLQMGRAGRCWPGCYFEVNRG